MNKTQNNGKLNYTLTLSNFAPTTSGNISISIARHSALDKVDKTENSSLNYYGSGNLLTEHIGSTRIDLVRPVIKYQYSNTTTKNPNIDHQEKTVTENHSIM